MSHTAELIRYLLNILKTALRLPINLGIHLIYLIPGLNTPAIPSIPDHLQDRECRFRLDNDSSDTITLPDGRKLGYAQYGSLSETAKTVFFIHGLPGSRVEGTYLDDIGKKLGARIIASDRPGYGWSSPHPGRKLLDFPKDLECLAMQLGIREYAVVGVSGGGPYALACAAGSPPTKLKGVALICGMGPPDIGMKGALLGHRTAFTGGWHITPYFINRWFWRLEPNGRLELSDKERMEMMLKPSRLKGMPSQDIPIYKDVDVLSVMLRVGREAFAQGYDHVLDDARLMCKDFGFQVKEIRKDLPVKLWYGKQDVFIPLAHGEQIAARLDGRADLRVLDETHTSIFINHKESALEDLLRIM
ncbi:alpha/beta-hydrolase [Massarina eburnea CBS 473.64]|uniref:Alpha/beta-hydrolase n=1 Tax=Massarina eburnea CBS 473.64 TaxID=1395130 RepID=A0A6A6S1P8_9PLEO|nr:alpha/beta-hydrolase [Massarina eburnea CBS 473.64]